MTVSRLSVASSLVVLALAGCSSKTPEENLNTQQDLLVSDDGEASGPDDASEAEEEATSGGGTDTETASGFDPDAVGVADRLGKIKSNPGKFFTPAGCIATTAADKVFTHVFTNCTGPGGRTFNGTVTATWTFESKKATVKREAKGFKIDGATVDRTVTVEYSTIATVYKRVRTVDLKGTTEKGKDFSRSATWTMTWDKAALCVTRDGTATTKIAEREHTVTIAGYRRCGVGAFGCPEGGKVTLDRKAGKGSDADLTLVIEFLGGRKMSILLPNGKKIERAMICREVLAK